jgi:hypothetical protein
MNVDIRGVLNDIRAPTLVLARPDDQLVPVEAAAALAAGIGDAQFRALPAGAHNVFDIFDLLGEQIVEFVCDNMHSHRERARARDGRVHGHRWVVATAQSLKTSVAFGCLTMNDVSEFSTRADLDLVGCAGPLGPHQRKPVRTRVRVSGLRWSQRVLTRPDTATDDDGYAPDRVWLVSELVSADADSAAVCAGTVGSMWIA